MMKKFNPKEVYEMKQKLADDFFLRRMAAWKEHRAVCERRKVPAIKWEDFKIVILRAHANTFDEMVDAGVARAVKEKEKRDTVATRTVIPFRRD